MNENNINIAIAESMGWSLADRKYLPWTAPDKERHQDVISYTTDLNACHEFEKTLDVDQQAEYVGKLGFKYYDCETQVFRVSHATAAQRCEAYLKTIGKYTS
jgi:hypothetical protein